MRAVVLDYESRSLEQIDVPEPGDMRQGDVLFRLTTIGVCGTDRDLARFRFGEPPPGTRHLILGHEALGEVIESRADGFSAGDWVVPMVRRACAPACISCARGRRDLCVTGHYTERGIMRAQGYFTEAAVDHAEDLLHVPAELVDVAILAEPLSVVEKAVALALQHHMELPARNALIIGAGTVGLLAALALRERGLDVVVASREAQGSDRARMVQSGGLTYRDATRESFDIVIEAAGSASALTAGLRALAPLGVLVVLGVQQSEALPLTGLIVGNQVVLGSVNAGPEHWQTALHDLARFDREFVKSLIHREPFRTFRDSIAGNPLPWPKVVHMMD